MFKVCNFQYFIIGLLLLTFVETVISPTIVDGNKLEFNNDESFHITNVLITYHLFDNDSYFCYFNFLINVINVTQYEFSLSLNLSQTITFHSLTILNNNINPSLTYVNNTTRADILFLLGSSFGSSFELFGVFSGFYGEKPTFIFDWGQVSNYQCNVFIENTLFVTEVIPQPKSISSLLNDYTQFSWVEYSEKSLSITIGYVKSASTSILISTLTSWEIRESKSITIELMSFVDYSLHCAVILPSWISANMTDFIIEGNGKKFIEFSIKVDEIPVNRRGEIRIITRELPILIQIPVEVLELPKENNIRNELILLLLLLSLLMNSLFLLSDKEIPLKDKLKSFISKNFTKDQEIEPSESPHLQTNPWEPIHEKWRNFLSHNELLVIKSLFEGPKTQQVLADEVGISKSAMSRLITKLEISRLVSRKRQGITNLISINFDRL